ncbi:hypothetical protein Fcan01_15662 [Folsomia candida]|uniref:Uncharacterized protein n=1 Tax=Folsomia candida TaxID=158441 RepID=A0A226DY06_FOLCA|nr:hypothetical protein Fcan01_15662 [Folsomia candida]
MAKIIFLTLVIAMVAVPCNSQLGGYCLLPCDWQPPPVLSACNPSPTAIQAKCSCKMYSGSEAICTSGTVCDFFRGCPAWAPPCPIGTLAGQMCICGAPSINQATLHCGTGQTCTTTGGLNQCK